MRTGKQLGRAIAAIVAGVICVFATGCCCRLRQHMRIVDKLEAVVIVGFDDPPKCVVPQRPFTGREARMGQPVRLWVREVHFDQIQKPIDARKVQLDVVDAFGHPLQRPEVLVEPDHVITAASGFNDQPVMVSCNVSHGEYLVRASYSDKGAMSASYSAPLFCR